MTHGVEKARFTELPEFLNYYRYCCCYYFLFQNSVARYTKVYCIVRVIVVDLSCSGSLFSCFSSDDKKEKY